MRRAETGNHADVLIVGTGMSALRPGRGDAAQEGFAGSIVCSGSGRDPPYERPPLSKTIWPARTRSSGC